MQFKYLNLWGLLAAAAAMSAMPVKAADALVDDFEGGTNQNKFSSFWYFYDDHTDGGSSVVTSSLPSPTAERLFDPTVSLGLDEKGGRAAKFSYTMGPAALTCGLTCEFGQYVGFGTDMTPTKAALDLTGATKITYKAKAVAATTVVVEVSTTPVTSQAAPQKYAVHNVTHNITTTWKTYEISLSETALTNPLKQPSWAKPVVAFDPKTVEKIAWKISMDAATNPLAGTILIDSVIVKNYTWANPAACIPCIGVQGAGTGALLSDFNLTPKNQNALGFYWYAYNDAAGRTVTAQSQYSEIFGGVVADSLVPTKPVLAIAGSKGVAASDAAWIQFTLGPIYLERGFTIKPFVGVGTRLADDLGLAHFNAKASTGISFDYQTTGADIDYIRMEVKDERNLGAGIVHYVLLPSTDGAWKSATIPWTKLVLPDYNEVKLIADKTLHTQALEQIQWTFQSDAKKTGTIAVDNVKIVGMTTITPANAGILSRNNSHSQNLTARNGRNGLQVSINLAAGKHVGSLELLDMRGIVLASQKVDLKGGMTSVVHMSLDKTAKGVYFIRLKTNNGKAVTEAMTQISLLD